MFSQANFPIAASTSTIQDPDVKALLACSQPGAISFYPVDTTIYAQGEASGPLYLVEFGTVRICSLTADGRRQITSFCHAGDVFGLEVGDEHASYAESVDGAGIRVLRPADAAGFNQRLLSLALRRFARIQHHILLLGRMTATEKLSSFLLDLLERQGGDDVVHLPMQRNDIADYLGLTFETVSRVLRVLKDRNVIRVQSVDRVEIIDLDAIETMAN